MRLTRSALALFATLLLGAQESLPFKFPAPAGGGATLAEALAARRTVRSLGGPALALAEAGQLLWAAQGENRPGAAHGALRPCPLPPGGVPDDRGQRDPAGPGSTSTRAPATS